jgi:phosphoglycerate dehydrogenase-like enzyme
MPDAAWVVNSARGKVRVKPSLVDAKTGTKNIRLGFELTIEPAAN